MMIQIGDRRVRIADSGGAHKNSVAKHPTRFAILIPPLRFPKRALLDYILNLLFPVTCVVCRAQVPERRWGGACPECWSSLIPLEPPFCRQCGEPAPAIEGLCGRCMTGETVFDFARSA